MLVGVHVGDRMNVSTIEWKNPIVTMGTKQSDVGYVPNPIEITKHVPMRKGSPKDKHGRSAMSRGLEK